MNLIFFLYKALCTFNALILYHLFTHRLTLSIYTITGGTPKVQSKLLVKQLDDKLGVFVV